MVLRTISIGLIALCTSGASASDDRAETRLDMALDLLAASERTVVTADYIDTPLALVLDDLRQLSELPLTADWSSLRLLGVNDRTRVTLRLDRVPLMTAMSALVMQFGDVIDRPTVEAHDGALVLTTRHAWPAMKIPHVYDVRDILAEPALLKRMIDAVGGPPLQSNAHEPEGEESKGDNHSRERDDNCDTDRRDDEKSNTGKRAAPPILPEDHFAPRRRNALPLPKSLTGPDRDDPPPPTFALQSLVDALAYLVVEHLDPEIWKTYGGQAAAIEPLDGQLLITAPPSVHRDVRELLSGLRAANPRGLALEVAVVDLPVAALSRLTRRHASGSPALYTSIITDDDAQSRLRISTPAARNRPLRFARESAGLHVVVELDADINDDDGLMRVEVETKMSSDVTTTELSTTVVFPWRTGTAIIEIERLGGVSSEDTGQAEHVHQGERVRLLLIRPRIDY